MRLSAILLLSTVLLAGCQTFERETPSQAGPVPGANYMSPALRGAAPLGEDRDFGRLVYRGTDVLAQRSPSSKEYPVVVATIVSLEDFNRSSTLGRLVSQLVANRLAQMGYYVKDLTYTRGLAIQPGTGALVLSEGARNAAQNTNAQTVVAGTYAIGGREVYVNLRLLRAEDGAILSSADIVLPLDHNVEAMVTAAAR